MPCSTSDKLKSRTMKRLTFWKTLSCCSVLCRRSSSSLLLAMRFHYNSDASPAGTLAGRRILGWLLAAIPVPIERRCLADRESDSRGAERSAMTDDPNHPPPNDRRPTDIPVPFHKTEKLLAALLETASQAILMIDRAGRMVLANRRAGEMFGYTTQELIGADIELLVPESKRAAHGRQREDYFQRPRARPAGIGLALSGRRKDGAEFPVEVSLSFVETEEGIFGIAFISDISVRKDLEEQLRNAQKMEAVGRLAGGVAHDFNNMLTVIAGYNRMILDELSTLDPMRGYAEEIHKAAERAGALTNKLLAFSRRQIMQPRVINLNAVILQTENMLRRLIGEDIQLVMSLSADAGNIRSDPNHIEQAIVNLAVNARDAMPLGGRISIETCNTPIDETYVKTDRKSV